MLSTEVKLGSLDLDAIATSFQDHIIREVGDPEKRATSLMSLASSWWQAAAGCEQENGAVDEEVFSPSPTFRRLSRSERDSVFVRGLPECGCIVITVTRHHAKYLREGLATLRGKAFAGRCKVISICRRGETYKLVGLRGHVAFHEVFTGRRNGDLVREVTELARDAAAACDEKP